MLLILWLFDRDDIFGRHNQRVFTGNDKQHCIYDRDGISGFISRWDSRREPRIAAKRRHPLQYSAILAAMYRKAVPQVELGVVAQKALSRDWRIPSLSMLQDAMPD